MRILVAYGSRYGSTRETATHIAARLGARGEVTLADAGSVTDVTGFDLAVVGSGIYFDRLRHRVTDLLHRFAEQAPATPLAIFALGPTASEREHPEDWESARRHVGEMVRRVEGLEVVDVQVFGGVLAPARLGRLLARRTGVDLRDWPMIDAWTDQVSRRAEADAA